MTYDYKEKKIVAIVSNELQPGMAMNALGHLAFSAGRYSDQSMMGKEKIIDSDNKAHTGISKYPFIVLKATKDEIKDIVKQAKAKNIFIVDYPQEMFDTGHDDELVAALSKAKEPAITYHAAVIVGNAEEIKKLTGHLKLYR
ncbi:DUF2000 domain-containing protein [Candidatus Woesearchaeota archaeon]|nr:DUF2000 domain-containing protein [Candidatus Woesearchaeota archaeon]